MKAIGIEIFGDVDQLKMLEVPQPKPSSQEILIDVEYAGVNPIDWKVREGMLKDMLPHHFPVILGFEVSGIVKEVGDAVTTFQIGDPVFACCFKPVMQWGSYAETVTLNAKNAVHKPANLSHAEAASLPVGALTAWQGLFDKGHLQKGQTVFIQAGAGGVGSFAIQFAKLHGATVITTAREENHSYVKNLGADYAIDYTNTDVPAQIKQHFPEGVDLVFDCLGPKGINTCISVLKPGGALITIVNQTVEQSQLPPKARFELFMMNNNADQLQHIAQLINDGQVKLPKITEMRLQDAASAHVKSQEGHTTGKIVLKVTRK
ncbi:MAG: NADP-dependent oxidoreductase [Chlamydiia bacterium]|nr:NADP-dependent oxidoreductase [Chlamydiia bacterium]